MESQTLTLWFDEREYVLVDREEFELIKLLLKDAGAVHDLKAAFGVIQDLESQGYERRRAMKLCIMARRELSGDRSPSWTF